MLRSVALSPLTVESMQGATDRGTHSSNTEPGSCIGLVHSTTDGPQAAVPHTPVPPVPPATHANGDARCARRSASPSRETKTTRPPLTRSIDTDTSSPPVLNHCPSHIAQLTPKPPCRLRAFSCSPSTDLSLRLLARSLASATAVSRTINHTCGLGKQ